METLSSMGISKTKLGRNLEVANREMLYFYQIIAISQIHPSSIKDVHVAQMITILTEV
jgi:hypothetical protein